MFFQYKILSMCQIHHNYTEFLLTICSVYLFFMLNLMVKQKSTAKITFSNFYFDGCGFGNDSIICRRIAQHPCDLCMVHNYTFGTYSTYKKYNRWFTLSFHSRRYTKYLICVYFQLSYTGSLIQISSQITFDNLFIFI